MAVILIVIVTLRGVRTPLVWRGSAFDVQNRFSRERTIKQLASDHRDVRPGRLDGDDRLERFLGDQTRQQ